MSETLKERPKMRSPMHRRDFLKWSGFSLAASFPAFLQKTAAALPVLVDGESSKVLVVIQLSGGNDGLSTVVPYSDPAYGRARGTTRIDEKSVIRIDERIGLHPNLLDIKELFDSGEAAVVQGASYPNPTRSHFEAMDVWHTADRAGARRGTGWLGRAIDSACGNKATPLFAVNLGGKLPLALLGETSKPVAFTNPGAFQWRGDRAERSVFERLNRPEPEMTGTAGPVQPLDYLRRVAADADASSDTIRKATQAYNAVASYPAGNRFAEDLRLVAAMIAARLETRVYYVSLSGFDTHANQRATHDNLLRAFSTAIGAFLKDLRTQKLLDRVLVMTFSEFGRRVKENGSGGTDHGVAGPMFFFGGALRGGLHGAHPSLEHLVDGDLAMTTDFRRVYATVLDGWLRVPSEKILGEKWTPLDLLSSGERVRAF